MNPRFKLFLLQHLDIDNINFSDTSILNEISNPRPVDWNNPIILVQTIEYPEFKVIDGNHRYQNAIQQNHHLPIQILPYDAITPDYFINTFNYLLFIIKNEFNRIYSLCAYSYDINTINSQIDDYKNHVLKLLETQ